MTINSGDFFNNEEVVKNFFPAKISVHAVFLQEMGNVAVTVFKYDHCLTLL